MVDYDLDSMTPKQILDKAIDFEENGKKEMLKSNFTRAVKFFEKSVEMIQTHNEYLYADKNERIQLKYAVEYLKSPLTLLARAYQKLENHQKSIENYRIVLDLLSRTAADDELLSEVAMNLTELLVVINQIQEAIEICEIYLPIVEKSQPKLNVAYVYVNLASYYALGEIFDRAFEASKQAMEIFDEELDISDPDYLKNVEIILFYAALVKDKPYYSVYYHRVKQYVPHLKPFEVAVEQAEELLQKKRQEDAATTDYANEEENDKIKQQFEEMNSMVKQLHPDVYDIHQANTKAEKFENAAKTASTSFDSFFQQILEQESVTKK